MSDLWNRCRAELRHCLSHDDWRRSIQPLRAWMDAGTLCLWVDRAPGDWRALANPARDFDAAIRKVAHKIWGREPTEIRYLDRPPSRDQSINQRRIREHRAKLREREEGAARRLWTYARQELHRLIENPGDLHLTGSEDEVRRKLEAMVMDRAKQRLEQETHRSGLFRGNRRPPEDPPPSPR